MFLYCYNRTFKKNCPVKISFVASNDGNHLEVRSFIGDHNHVINKVC